MDAWDAVDFEIAIEITQNSIYPDGNATECPSSAVTFAIPVVNMPVVAWTTPDAAVCEGDIATLVAEVVSVEGASTTLSWTSDLGGGSANVLSSAEGYDLTIPVPLSETSGSTIVTLTPTDNFGCVGQSIEGLIEYFVAPDPTGTVAPLCEETTWNPWMWFRVWFEQPGPTMAPTATSPSGRRMRLD